MRDDMMGNENSESGASEEMMLMKKRREREMRTHRESCRSSLFSCPFIFSLSPSLSSFASIRNPDTFRRR